VNLSFRVIASGFRFPDSKNLADFVQWSRLIDLIHRLGINVFLDVGANRGTFSKHLRVGGYRGRLISFEPIPEDQERIRALANGDDDWTVCGYALGAESGRRHFNVNLSDDKTVFSSFLSIKQKVDGARTIPVEVRRLLPQMPQ
jgi:FkbM family methyltransferase